MNRLEVVEYLEAEKNKALEGVASIDEVMNELQLHFLGIKLFDVTIYDYDLTIKKGRWVWKDSSEPMTRGDFVAFMSTLKDRC